MKLANSIILSITVILYLLITVLYNNISIFLIWILFLLFGILITRLRIDKDIRIVQLFVFAFSIYSLYVLITNFFLIDNPYHTFFYAIDSVKFFNASDNIFSFEELVYQYNSNIEKGYTKEYRLFNLISLIISYLSSSVGGRNNLISQTLQSSFFASLSISYLFLTIKKYTSSIYALRASLYYSIFGFVFTFSAVFTRDIHILFFYTYGMYLFVNYKNKWNLYKLIALTIVVFFIRYESGIFFGIFFVLSFYLRSKKNKVSRFVFLLIIPLIIGILFKFLPTALETLNHYSEIQSSEGGGGDSIVGFLSKLPIGIKQFSIAIVSQLYPLPFYRNLAPIKGVDLLHNYSYNKFRIFEALSGFFWVGVWISIIYGFFIAKFKIKNLLPEIRLCFFIAILYIILTTADINVRRTMAVYPFIYLLSSIFVSHFSVYQFKDVRARSIAFLGIMYFVYFLIK